MNSNNVFYLVVAAIIFAAIFIFRKKRKSFRFHKFGKVDKEMKYISTLGGLEFEYYAKNLLRKIGFKKVSVTKSTGDFGVDVFAVKNNLKFAIQCKRYKGVVGIKAVQEIISGKQYYKCDRAVVMTNSWFSPAAKELATKTGVILWDKQTVAQMVVNVNKRIKKGVISNV